jgi:hypothetical protein
MHQDATGRFDPASAIEVSHGVVEDLSVAWRPAARPGG